MVAVAHHQYDVCMRYDTLLRKLRPPSKQTLLNTFLTCGHRLSPNHGAAHELNRQDDFLKTRVSVLILKSHQRQPPLNTLFQWKELQDVLVIAQDKILRGGLGLLAHHLWQLCHILSATSSTIPDPQLCNSASYHSSFCQWYFQLSWNRTRSLWYQGIAICSLSLCLWSEPDSFDYWYCKNVSLLKCIFDHWLRTHNKCTCVGWLLNIAKRDIVAILLFCCWHHLLSCIVLAGYCRFCWLVISGCVGWLLQGGRFLASSSPPSSAAGSAGLLLLCKQQLSLVC